MLIVDDFSLTLRLCKSLVGRLFNGEIDTDPGDAASTLVGSSAVLSAGIDSAKDKPLATVLPTSAKVHN